MASKPGERRHQILQTLAAMLENPRAEKVTTAALASKLDVSEAALYRHFASKEALYAAIIARKIDGSEPIVAHEAAAVAGDDRGVFGGLARRMIERIEADPAFIRILHFTALEGHSLAEPFFASRVLRVREFLSSYIARRIREGAFRAVDPVIAARAFLGMVSDYMNVRVVFRQEAVYQQPVEEVVETFVSIFLGGIRNPSGDKR
jgi:AcrR family transcriptional regulator